MRIRLVTMLVLSACAMVAAGCDSQQKDLIARALQHPMSDGYLAVDASVTQAGGKLFTFTVEGPYRSNGPAKLQSFDLKARFALNMLGTARSATFRAISTGDDVFVRYRGVTYEVGKARIAAFNQHSARQAARLGNPRTLGDFERLGLNLDSWFPDSQIVGDDTVDGVAVTHLHGRIDVEALLNDIAGFITKNAPAGSLTPQARQFLTPHVAGRVKNVLTNPTFDVFVDKASGEFRRIAVNTGIKVPGGPNSLAFGMRFDWRDVGRTQAIQAPSGGRPIEDLGTVLKKQFGLPADLGTQAG